MSDSHQSDLDYLEKLDRFLEDENEGTIPADLIAAAGVEMPPSSELEEDELGRKLFDVTTVMGELGIYLDSTDHMGDRELYDYLREDALKRPNLVLPDDPYFALTMSPIGGCSDEDNLIYLRYYADDETRDMFQRDFPDDELPDKEKPPYDRDRHLPSQMERIARSEEIPS